MKKLVFGLLATGFITLSSFTSIADGKANSKVEDGYSCCTAHNASWSQTVTVCSNGSDNCAKALKAYYAIY